MSLSCAYVKIRRAASFRASCLRRAALPQSSVVRSSGTLVLDTRPHKRLRFWTANRRRSGSRHRKDGAHKSGAVRREVEPADSYSPLGSLLSFRTRRAPRNALL